MALTPEQRVVVEARGPEVLAVAGAGTGKTHALVERYLALLEEHEAAEIVAVTFTEAAAAEMRERVRREMGARPELARHLPALDEAPIGTIHALCLRILLEHAAEAGIDAEARVMAEDESEYEVVIASSDALEVASTGGSGALAILELSNEAGPESVVELLAGMVRSRDDVRLAFAAMGSGRAEVTARVARMLAEHTALLARAAQSNLAGALEALEAVDCRDTADHLYPSWVAAIEALEELSNEPPDRDYLTERCSIIGAMGSRGRGVSWSVTPVELRARIRRVAEAVAPLLTAGWNAHDARGIEATLALRAVFDDACDRYGERKRRLRALDYLDMEIRTRDLLAAQPEIAAAYRRSFRHLLVDEYQDTNPIQVEIIGLLAGDGEVARFYVGDAKQAIYRFRGGDVRAFSRARITLERANGVLPLSQSFRSHAGIVAVVNAVFGAVFRGAARDFEAVMDPLAGREGEPPGGPHVTVMTVAAERGTVHEDDRTRFEAYLIAREIRGLIDEGRPIWDRREGWRPVRPGDIALVMRRFTKVGLFEEALSAVGIPSESQSGGGFFQRPEVVDLTNLLGWLAEQGDEIALLGALRSPLFMLDDETLLRLRGGRKRPFILGLRGAEGFDGAAAERLQQIAAVLDGLTALAARESVDAVIAEALARTGFEASWAALPDGARAVANIRKLRQMAQSLRSPSLDEFVEYLVRRREELAAREAQAALDETDAVRLLTVHGAKGLEFPIVFVAEANNAVRNQPEAIAWHRERGLSLTLAKEDEDEGSRPRPGFYSLLMAVDNEEDVAEHRRLFYVACTRASDYLFITGDAPAENAKPKDTWLDWADPALRALDRRLVEIRAPVALDMGLLQRATPRPVIVPPEADETAFVAPLAARPAVIPVRTSTPVTALLEERDLSGYGHGDGLAAFRGTLAHRAIQLRYGGGAMPPPIELARQVADRPMASADLERIAAEVEEFLAGFARSSLGRTLAEGPPETYFELPFAWDWDGVPVHGVIDLAYRDSAGGWHVVDFKTDRIEGRGAAAVARPYLAQLGLYGLALERATGVRPALWISLLRSGELYQCAWPDAERAVAEARERIDRGAELAAEQVDLG